MPKKVGRSGAQGITQAEVDRTEFEDPTNASAGTIKSFGSDGEEE